MKSKVISLYDYKSIPLPEERLAIRFSEEDMQKELERLARKHAVLQSCVEVQKGDVALCALSSSAPRFNRSSIQFVSGKYLFDKTVEDSVIGMKPGESKKVDVAGVDVDITLQQAHRKPPAPVDDLLIQKEAIEGVRTVDEYRVFYKEKTLAARRREATVFLAVMLRDEIAKRSQFDFNEEEKDSEIKIAVEFMKKRQEQRDSLPESSSEEGQELQRSFEEQALRGYLIRLVSEQFELENNAPCAYDDYQEYVKNIAAAKNIPLDEAMEKESFENYKKRSCRFSMLDILCKYTAEQLKEE